MPRYLLLTVMLIAAFGHLALGQSRPQTPGNGKANKRPVAVATPTPAESTIAVEPKAVEAGAIVDDEVLTVDTDLVVIPTKVLDRRGRFIAGLKKEDFTLLEDGAPTEITYFSNTSEPFTVALVLDMSYSTIFKIDQIQSAAINFVSQLRAVDQVMVVSFDQEVHLLTEPTSDKERAISAIKSTRVSSGTSLYEALDLVLNKRLKKIKGRKAVILFTDGVDTSSLAAGKDTNLRDTYESDVLIYPIQYDTYSDVQRQAGSPKIPSPLPQPENNPLPIPLPLPGSTGGVFGGSGTTAEEYEAAKEYLQELATQTGGRLYRASTATDLAVAFKSIADELRETYSLGFYPGEEKRNKKRIKLKVRVSRENAVVRARDSYVLSKKEKSK